MFLGQHHKDAGETGGIHAAAKPWTIGCDQFDGAGADAQPGWPGEPSVAINDIQRRVQGAVRSPAANGDHFGHQIAGLDPAEAIIGNGHAVPILVSELATTGCRMAMNMPTHIAPKPSPDGNGVFMSGFRFASGAHGQNRIEPPKAKEFDRATLKRVWRVSLGT